MTIRGDGGPRSYMAGKAASENGSVPPELRRRCARLHHGPGPSRSTEYKLAARPSKPRYGELPSDRPKSHLGGVRHGHASHQTE
jgi:hypothetical protein